MVRMKEGLFGLWLICKFCEINEVLSQDGSVVKPSDEFSPWAHIVPSDLHIWKQTNECLKKYETSFTYSRLWSLEMLPNLFYEESIIVLSKVKKIIDCYLTNKKEILKNEQVSNMWKRMCDDVEFVPGMENQFV